MVQCGPIWFSVHGFVQPRSGSLLTALKAGAQATNETQFLLGSLTELFYSDTRCL